MRMLTVIRLKCLMTSKILLIQMLVPFWWCRTDPKIVKAIGQKAKKAGIPLVVVTVKPNDEDLQYVNSYVGSEEITGGQMQAEFIVDSLKGKPANARF